MSVCIEIAHRQQLFIYRGRMMCMGHVYVRTSVRTIECKQLSAKSKTLKAERCVEVETVQRWVSTIQTQQTDWHLVCSPLSTCSNRLILIKSKKSHMLSGTTTTLWEPARNYSVQVLISVFACVSRVQTWAGCLGQCHCPGSVCCRAWTVCCRMCVRW